MRLAIREEAEKDIRAAMMWYATQRPGFEMEFVGALNEVFLFLLRWPGRAQRIKGPIRQLPMERFPYSIVHTIARDELVVLRVFHHKRNPRTMLRKGRRER